MTHPDNFVSQSKSNHDVPEDVTDALVELYNPVAIEAKPDPWLSTLGADKLSGEAITDAYN